MKDHTMFQNQPIIMSIIDHDLGVHSHKGTGRFYQTDDYMEWECSASFEYYMERERCALVTM